MEKIEYRSTGVQEYRSAGVQEYREGTKLKRLFTKF